MDGTLAVTGTCFIRTVSAASKSYKAEEELDDSKRGQRATTKAAHVV